MTRNRPSYPPAAHGPCDDARSRSVDAARPGPR